MMCDKLSVGRGMQTERCFQMHLKACRKSSEIFFVLKLTYITDCWMSNPAVPARQNVQQL